MAAFLSDSPRRSTRDGQRSPVRFRIDMNLTKRSDRRRLKLGG